MDQNLVDFVQTAVARGESKEEIISQLQTAGWTQDSINQVLATVTFPQIDTTQVVQVPIIPMDSVSPTSDSTATLPNDNRDPQSSIPIEPSPVTSSTRRNFIPLILGILLLLFVVAGIILFVLFRNRIVNTKKKATDITVAQPHPTAVATQQYSNKDLGFSLAIPDSWSIKEYPNGTFGNETRVVFGKEEDLPKDFFSEGSYVWMSIYPTSDTERYNEYLYSVNHVGQNQIRETTLGGEKAIDNGVTVSVEHNAMIYTLYPITIQRADLTLEYTKESQQIVSSFTFTNAATPLPTSFTDEDQEPSE